MRLKSKQIRRRDAFFITSFLIVAASYRIPIPVTTYVQYIKDGRYPVCPRCGSSFDREYTAFCDRCGQRLFWFIWYFSKILDPPRKTDR